MAYIYIEYQTASNRRMTLPTLKVNAIATTCIKQAVYHSLLLDCCSNLNTYQHHFQNITNFAVYLIAHDHEKSIFVN